MALARRNFKIFISILIYNLNYITNCLYTFFFVIIILKNIEYFTKTKIMQEVDHSFDIVDNILCGPWPDQSYCQLLEHCHIITMAIN